MLIAYIEKKLQLGQYKLLRNRTYFGEIPGLRGVWASGKTLEECRNELKEVLEDWLVLKLRDRETIPGFRVRARQANRPAVTIK